MTSNFLSSLANQLNQYSSANVNRAQDVAVNGNASRLGIMGDITQRNSVFTERKYVQEGYLRTTANNTSAKLMEIMFQEPDITVLVKKRAFCALAENFDLSHMDADEKLFYQASKILFSNKCQQIAAYEALSKINRISEAAGTLSTQLIPLVISLTNDLAMSTGNFTTSTPPTITAGTDPTGGGLSALQAAIAKVLNTFAFSNNSFYTTWLTDVSNLFKSKLGPGTGVIEFCNVQNINSNLSLEFGGGSISLQISDPYNMMVITNFDIEKALTDATNPVYNNGVNTFGQSGIDALISLNTGTLNNIRSLRNAGPVQFISNPSTTSSNQVIAVLSNTGDSLNFTFDQSDSISGGPGNGVVVSSDSLVGGPLGSQGLDPISEVPLFATIIQNIYSKIQIQLSTPTVSQVNSNTTNYARRKLRLHYNGKQIIQPMDQIHVFIKSKARLDNKISNPMQGPSGLGFLQNLNNTSAGFQSTFSSSFNPNGNANFQLEKTLLVGNDFPNWLWTLTRSMFITDNAGVSVFGGVVTEANSSYSNGSYNTTVSGRDMTYYLELGRVNVKPAISVFNGPLYDPLTPFKTSIDAVSNVAASNAFDLLDENKDLLASNSIKFKAGHLYGKQATEQNMNQQDAEQSNFGQIRQVFYAPDGLVYKWKEGIGTLVQFSNSYQIQGDNTIGAVAITKSPYAGQDVMNVISLSITGQPYNYSTFYKAAAEVNGFGRDPQTGQDAAFSFYSSLTRDLTKNNLLWGNFIPFKNLFMSEATFQKVITAQFKINQVNDVVNQQLSTINDLTNQLQSILGISTSNLSLLSKQTTAQSDALVNSLKNQLQAAVNVINTQNQSTLNQYANNLGSQGLSIVGNDVSYDPNSTVNADSGNNSSLSDPSQRKDLRRKVNFLTRRLSWQVRSNEDKNLFIVDDSYDKDYDIQAFEKAIDTPQLFESQFVNMLENIKTAAGLLNLEVFCDSQGHIRVRPPMYNKMPSSIFYDMLRMNQQNGVQVYPQFLDTLFVNQLQSLETSVEVIEAQIRLDCALLGKVTDNDCYSVIRGLLGGAQNNNSLGETGNFTFLTDETTGNILAFNALYTEANPDAKLSQINNTIEGQLQTQAGINNLFNSVSRAAFIVTSASVNNLLTKQQSTNPTISPTAQTRINTLQQYLQTKTGQQVNIDQFESPNASLAQRNPSAMVPDIFKITNDIATQLSQRQKLVKQLYSAVKNANEAVSLNSTTNTSNTANNLLISNFSPNSQIPEIFEEMIEDESYDDLGPGSGKRYVIEDYQILSFNVREVPPEFTMIQVNGQLDLFLPNDQLPNDLGASPVSGQSGGNALITAAAVDYDMWRMYGFRNTSSVMAPFLSDPNSQCAPYAASILSRNRKNILQGNITIIGNEYAQVGDTIYLRSRDLLFYVSQVGQNFQYGTPGSFSTNLTLTYGHCPGEYIPTTLDVIGKLLYNNRSNTNYINYRQNNAGNQQPVGVIIIDNRTTDPEAQIFGGTYGTQNVKVLNDILYTTYYAIQSNQDPNNNISANVEIRVFYNSTSGAVNSTLTTAAQTINQMLIGQYQYQQMSPFTTSGNFLQQSNITVGGTANVDTSGMNEQRSPSQKAIDMIRNIMSTSSTPNGAPTTSQTINQVLFSYIIDIWITFTYTANPSTQ